MIFFGRRGALALDDGACGPLLFQKGGIFPTTNHLRFIHITSYPILIIHQVFMLIEISKIQFIGTQEVNHSINHVDMNHIGGYAIIKTGRRNGLTFSVCM